MFSLTKCITIACFAASFCIISPATYADPPEGRGHGKGRGHFKDKNHWEEREEFEENEEQEEKGPWKTSKILARFSQKDRMNILNYFNANPFPIKPLPPGIAKNLARGKPLPPGIAKQSLPPDVLSLLPKYPGYEYLAAGNNVLLVNETSKIIADILPNLLK